MEREISFSGGVVRVDVADPNVMCRFQQAVDSLPELSKGLKAQQEPLSALWQADRELKKLLGWVLGCDLDKAMQGKSLFTMVSGQSLLDELLDALAPALIQGAQEWAMQQRERYGCV